MQVPVDNDVFQFAKLIAAQAANLTLDWFQSLDLKVDINTKASSLSENRHEVVLRITIDAATKGRKSGFIIEIQQAGVFEIEGVFGDDLRKVLGVTCPTTLFPYLRECVDSLITKGGFPAINLAPINFEMVFQEALKRSQQKQTITH